MTTDKVVALVFKLIKLEAPLNLPRREVSSLYEHTVFSSVTISVTSLTLNVLLLYFSTGWGVLGLSLHTQFSNVSLSSSISDRSAISGVTLLLLFANQPQRCPGAERGHLYSMNERDPLYFHLAGCRSWATDKGSSAYISGIIPESYGTCSRFRRRDPKTHSISRWSENVSMIYLQITVIETQ